MNELNRLRDLNPHGIVNPTPPTTCRVALAEAIEAERLDRKHVRAARPTRRRVLFASMACALVLLSVPFIVGQRKDAAPVEASNAVEFSLVADRVAGAPDPFQLAPGEFLAERSKIFIAESLGPEVAAEGLKPGLAAWIQTEKVESKSWMTSRGELVNELTPKTIPVEFPTAEDRKNWIAAGRPGIVVGVTMPNASSGNRDRPFPLGVELFSYAQLRDLPQDPEALRATINGLTIEDTAGTDASRMMTVVQPLLSYPISQLTRSALFRMLADTPGIEHRTDMRDALDRPADAIVWEDPLYRYELLYDPATGVDLEHRRFVADLELAPKPTAYRVGMLTERRTVVARRVVDSKNDQP